MGSTMLDEVVRDGVARSSRARGDGEFAVNSAQVSVDGAGADHEAFGNLRVGQAERKQTQHLDFAESQLAGKSLGKGWSSLCAGSKGLFGGHLASFCPGNCIDLS